MLITKLFLFCYNFVQFYLVTLRLRLEKKRLGLLRGDRMYSLIACETDCRRLLKESRCASEGRPAGTRPDRLLRTVSATGADACLLPMNDFEP